MEGGDSPSAVVITVGPLFGKWALGGGVLAGSTAAGALEVAVVEEGTMIYGKTLVVQFSYREPRPKMRDTKTGKLEENNVCQSLQ